MSRLGEEASQASPFASTPCQLMVGEEPVGIAAVDAKNPREEFKRIRQQLQARGLIGIRDDFAWKA